MGAPNGPPMAGMAPGSMMPGYQSWGSNPAAGYGKLSSPEPIFFIKISFLNHLVFIIGYAAPTAPGGYQGWGAPATPQAPPQWNSGYSAAQQPGYGSYGTNIPFLLNRAKFPTFRVNSNKISLQLHKPLLKPGMEIAGIGACRRTAQSPDKPPRKVCLRLKAHLMSSSSIKRMTFLQAIYIQETPRARRPVI